MVKTDVMKGEVRSDAPDNSTMAGEYEVGDSVYVDYGDCGRLGPGKVSAKVFFEVEGEEPWLGYEVTFKVSKVRNVSHGWYDEGRLASA